MMGMEGRVLANAMFAGLVSMACASPCTCSQSFQCSDNADCSHMGTCLADGRYCDCERGRVGDDCAASAISLAPDTAVEVWLKDEHALKTVHMDGSHGGLYWSGDNSLRRSFVLYDMTQLAGDLSSTESGGAYIYIKHDCAGLTEIAPVQDTEAWSSVASMTMQQAIDSFPISGTDEAGTVNYNHHTGPCCPHNHCRSPKCYPRLDVTKLVLAAMEGPRKLGFRMRGLGNGWCRAGKDNIKLELRGMTRPSPPPPPPPSPINSISPSGSAEDRTLDATEDQGSDADKSSDPAKGSEQAKNEAGTRLWQQDWFWGMIGSIIAFFTLIIAGVQYFNKRRIQALEAEVCRLRQGGC